jgi:site-specific recombinase XerD
MVNFMADSLLDLHSVTEDDVVAYLADLPAKGALRGMVLRALRSYYGFAEDREWCVSPVGRLRPKREKYGPAPSLSDDELTRLVIAAAARSERRAWILLLLYATGARADSLCQVRREDVQGGAIHFRVAKGDRPYSVPLGHVGREATAALLEDPRPGGFLIGIQYGRLYEIVRQAGRDSGVHVWPHLLRHTFSTKVARATDPRTWQELMNHADLSQFRRYVATDEERTRAAVEAL